MHFVIIVGNDQIKVQESLSSVHWNQREGKLYFNPLSVFSVSSCFYLTLLMYWTSAKLHIRTIVLFFLRKQRSCLYSNTWFRQIQAKVKFFKLWQVDHFLLWDFFKFIATKEPNSGKYFLRTIVPRKYMRKISAFVAINLKKPQSRKWSTCQSLKIFTLGQQGQLFLLLRYQWFDGNFNIRKSKNFKNPGYFWDRQTPIYKSFTFSYYNDINLLTLKLYWVNSIISIILINYH